MYAFDLETFIDCCVKDGDSAKEIEENLKWAKQIDGKLVDTHKEFWGTCEGFLVEKSWCREVKNPMIFSKDIYLQKSSIGDGWCHRLDGRVVEFMNKNDYIGFCDCYLILKDWCKEVEL